MSCRFQLGVESFYSKQPAQLQSKKVDKETNSVNVSNRR